MFQFGKLSFHFHEHKFSYSLLLVLVVIGFFTGCCYTNFLSQTDFLSAGVQAEEFIKQAKEHELNFRLMLSEEISAYLLIALFSLCLPGFVPTVFLVFKWGFSSGFFLTFLIKYFSMKGFFLGGIFLLTGLIFFLPGLILLSRKSLSVNKYLIASALQHAPSKTTLAQELLSMSVITLVTALLVVTGVSFKFVLLSPLSNYLFL